MLSSRTVVGLTVALLFAVTSCDGTTDPKPDTGASPTAAPSTASGGSQREQVTRLPRHLSGTVARLGTLPTEFPSSLASMRPVSFGPGATGAQLSYRPRETIHDGSGWSSEVVALLLRDNTWARLSLGSLGLPADLWPGQDMLGPGDLNEDGSKLAFAADRGVLVIDLATGAHRLHAGEAGPVGLITWRPGGTRLAADRIERGRDIIVDVRSGDVTAAPAGALEVGSGEFTSWSAADRVAHRDWGHGRHAVRVTDVVSDKSVATLTWSGRTNMFLHVHGWWDLDRILLSMDRSLVTWAPATGEVRRVATLPRSDTGREHASVGLDFPDPLG